MEKEAFAKLPKWKRDNKKKARQISPFFPGKNVEFFTQHVNY